MSLARTHALREVPKYDYREATTFCGKVGVKDRSTDSEYVTVLGIRFEVAIGSYKPTCKRCRAALIDGGPAHG